MALPLPLLEEHTASRQLGALWQNLHRSGYVPAARGPVLMLALPPAWENRFQTLLYSRAAAHGVAVAGVRHPDDLIHISWPGPVVLHAHWFASVFTSALSEADAMGRLHKMIAAIDTFAERTGAQLLWSAHNVFPHGNRFPKTNLALRRWIFERFEMLHVMDDSHVDVLEQAFGRSAPPVFCVPHMTYHGAVPDSLDKATARAHFGIARDAFVFGAFGSLQQYKNLDGFLDVFTAIADAHPARPLAALVGGVPGDVDFARVLATRFGDDPRITLIPRMIEDAEIQYMHHGADVMVMPYRDTLNSGAAMMAATFERPFVMPDTIAAKAMVPLGARLYDPAAPDGLQRALESCLAEGDAPVMPQTAPAALATRAPHYISEAFMTAVLDRL